MDNFIVSARKYRPATFATVVGQSAITNTLKNAIKNQQIAQAFLFTGPRGVGKTTCARIMAKTINCEAITDDGEACDTCTSCLSFNRSASFNIFELDAASNNTVEDIRNLVDQVRIPPQNGYKVYIVDEVHMLSQSAFNAFLKTLEEPPPYAKFILATTEKHKILPTILSRCQIFDFRRISVDDIAHHLQYVATSENIEAEPQALHIIAQKADGGLRDALSMFDQLVSFAGNNLTYKQVIENLNVLDYEYYFKITDHILEGDISNTLLTINEIIENGFEGQHFITGLGQHLRNLLVSKDQVTLQLLETSNAIRDQYYHQSLKCSVPFLLQSLEITNECDINYKTSNNKKLHVEIALMQLCRLSMPEFTSGNPVTNPAANSTSATAGSSASSATRNTSTSNPTSQTAASQLAGNTSTSNPTATDKSPQSDSNKPTSKPAPQSDSNASASSSTPSAGTASAGAPSPIEPVVAAKPTTSKPSAPPASNQIASTGQSENSTEKQPANTTPPSLTGMNFASLMSGKKDKKEKTQEGEEEEIPGESYGNEHVSISEVLKGWPVMAEKLAGERPLLHSTLLWKTPQLLDNYVISISIENPLQYDEISKYKNEITLFLRKELKNDAVSITTELIEGVQQTRRPYTDNEKFDFIADKAPVLKIMKDQLGLELDM